MGIPRGALGRLGERAAAAEAERRGWNVEARNVRLAGGEIDLVALDGRTVVFVEVKARASGRYGSGAAAVTPVKMKRIANAALAFLQRRHWTDRPCRGDVCVVGWRTGGDGSDDVLTLDWRVGAMPLGEFV